MGNTQFFNEKLEKIQDHMFDIALVFKEICEKNNLRYYIAYGTLLGAVRHQGFIPWDDDMDFVMPRKDWEKFIKIAPKELEKLSGGNYVLRECRLDNKYKYLWMRIMDKRTSFCETSRLADVGGIYIDIDPLDGTFKNKICQKIHSWFIDRLVVLRWYTIFRKPKYAKKRLNRFGLKIIHLVFGNVFAYKMFHFVIGLKTYDNSCCVRSLGYSSSKEVLAKEIYEKPVMLKFRNVEFCAPRKYDEYLKNFYGDYMTPLPEHQREVHYNMEEVVILDT